MITAPPTTNEQMLRIRYGLDRNPWPRRILVGAVVAGFLAVLVFTGFALGSNAGVEGKALAWQAGPTSVTVEVELRGSSTGPVTCVVRAQDVRSTDIGYREVTFPSSPTTRSVEIPTLFRASSVAILGCAPAGTEVRVPPPDFPPGVAIP